MVGVEVVGLNVGGLDCVGLAVGLDVVRDDVDGLKVGTEVLGLEVGAMVGLAVIG